MTRVYLFEMEPLVKKFHQLICDHMPKMRAHFQPKRYVLPAGVSDLYAPTGVALASDLIEFVAAVQKCADYERGINRDANLLYSGLNVLVAQEKWASLGCPNYYLGTDIGKAIVDTEPPADFLIEDIKLPFSAMRIWIPRDWYPLLGKHLCYIDICLVRKDDQPTINAGLASEAWNTNFAPDFPQGKPRANYAMDQLVVNAVVNEGEPTLIRFGFEWENGTIGSLLAESRARRDASGDDPSEWYGTNMLPFIINLLLVLGGVPDEVSEEKCVTPAKIGSGGRVKKAAIWQPAFIGQPTFQPLDSLQSSGAVESSSDRKLPSHVRRGHWKRQAHGQGWTQRKLIWVHLYRTGKQEEDLLSVSHAR